MIPFQEVILELIRRWKKFVNASIGLLVHKSDVEEWCRTCKICIAKKDPPKKGKSPLQIFNVGAPFERVEMDILGPLPGTFSGNKYLLVNTDCFTKWVEAFSLRSVRTKKMAEVFVMQIVFRHGVPLELHTN